MKDYTYNTKEEDDLWADMVLEREAEDRKRKIEWLDMSMAGRRILISMKMKIAGRLQIHPEKIPTELIADLLIIARNLWK